MPYSFLIDTNLTIDAGDDAVAAVLRDFGVSVEGTTDLALIGREIRAHKPDLAYIPSADWFRSLRTGDRHYRGLVMPTSKFTGTTDLPSVLVVRKDDPAKGLMDLQGASYGYINQSCTSSYFPPIVMLHKRGAHRGVDRMGAAVVCRLRLLQTLPLRRRSPLLPRTRHAASRHLKCARWWDGTTPEASAEPSSASAGDRPGRGPRSRRALSGGGHHGTVSPL